jgi:hypothetical protein
MKEEDGAALLSSAALICCVYCNAIPGSGKQPPTKDLTTGSSRASRHRCSIKRHREPVLDPLCAFRT